MKKRKGVKGIHFTLGIILGLLILLVIGTMAVTMIQNAGDASQGCSYLANIISDATGGKITLC